MSQNRAREPACLATLVARCTSLLLSCGCPPYPNYPSPVSSVDVFVFVFFVTGFFDPQPLA